ncbi:MAG: hypothetical protein ACPGVB_06205 [Chitinophagales bacterium]
MKQKNSAIKEYLILLEEYTTKLEEYYQELEKNKKTFRKSIILLTLSIVGVTINHMVIFNLPYDWWNVNFTILSSFTIVGILWLFSFGMYRKRELQDNKQVEKDISWVRVKVLKLTRMVSQYNEHIEKDELIKLKINFSLTNAEHVLYKTRKYMQDYHYESIVKKSKEEELEIVKKLEAEKTS